MSKQVKHLALAGFVLPVTFVGYHLLLDAGSGDAAALASTGDPVMFTEEDLAVGVTFDLSDLNLFEKNLYFVQQRYVERQRLPPCWSSSRSTTSRS